MDGQPAKALVDRVSEASEVLAELESARVLEDSEAKDSEALEDKALVELASEDSEWELQVWEVPVWEDLAMVVKALEVQA